MTSPWQPDDPEPDHLTERRLRMAKAVSFAMLGVEDRWRDWLPFADEILALLAIQLGIRNKIEKFADKNGMGEQQ